jgi:hypothetical protein
MISCPKEILRGFDQLKAVLSERNIDTGQLSHTSISHPLYLPFRRAIFIWPQASRYSTHVAMDAFSDIKPVPPDVILSWPKPNYTDPDRRGPALLIVNCFLLPLAMIVVGLRLYTRLIIVHSAGLDDMFLSICFSKFSIVTLH